MTKTMNYTQLVEDFINSDLELDQFFERIPLYEQPAFMRTFKDYTMKLALENEDYHIIEDLQKMDAQTDRYEDAIITELAAKEKYEKSVADLDKSIEEMNETRVGVRNYVIECIVTEANNAKPMLELAAKLIELEKDIDFYQPENWKAIAHLL
jgi:hypothetical protein